MASRLSEDPERSVLLLEAGPDYPEIDNLPDEVRHGYATATDVMTSDHNWQFIGKASETAGPMMVPRGRVTGGSSAINGQMFLRGVPEDYDTWASFGNDEWKFESLLPYFRKLETDTDIHDDFHGTDGPIIARRFKPDEWLPAQSAFRAACLANGFPESPDLNNPDSTGLSPVPFNNPNGIRWSTALGYLNPSRHRLNLTLRPNCTVRRVVFEGNRGRGAGGGERRRGVPGGGRGDNSQRRGYRLAPDTDAVRRGAGGAPEGYGHTGGAGHAWGGAEPARPSDRVRDVEDEGGCRAGRFRA